MKTSAFSNRQDRICILLFLNSSIYDITGGDRRWYFPGSVHNGIINYCPANCLIFRTQACIKYQERKSVTAFIAKSG